MVYTILALVTVMKSIPKNTPLTPSTLNNCRASGEPRAEMGEGKSTVPDSNTGTPGMNLRLLGLGVSCTWMGKRGEWKDSREDGRG